LSDSATTPALTPALEDYLETIYRLVGQSGFARVKDIAGARDVRPASVSPALKRLDDMGLVQYERREYVGLTPAGEEAARKIYARHQVLSRFLSTVLDLPREVAERDACAAEHSLSPETLDRIVRLFEYLEVCPQSTDMLDRFHHCSLVQPEASPCSHPCPAMSRQQMRSKTISINDLLPGQRGRVLQIECQGAERQHLLDMGILPDAQVELTRREPESGSVLIKLQGYELALSMDEAASVMVEAG